MVSVRGGAFTRIALVGPIALSAGKTIALARYGMGHERRRVAEVDGSAFTITTVLPAAVVNGARKGYRARS